MREIILTQGKVALVDEEDFERVNQYAWHTFVDTKNGRNYAIRRMPISDKNPKKVQNMHRFILGITDPKVQVDHIGSGIESGLDNRRSNLRIATCAENQRNRGKQKNNTSGFKGVHWNKSHGQYHARTIHNGKEISGGYFDDPREAAAKYNELAKKYHGEFAFFNDLTEREE